MPRKPKALPDYFTAEESQVLVSAAPTPVAIKCALN